MPKSSAPRKKPSPRSKQNRRSIDIINQAQALDRRRQAQINNQVATIDRLLAVIDGGEATSSTAVYGEEMKILHQGAAALRVQLEDTERAARELVEAMDAAPLDGLQVGQGASLTRLAEAVARVRALVGLSASVSESGDEAG